MSRKHFITTLGTGNYKETDYTWNGTKKSTEFVQEAILSIVLKDFTEEDRVTIVTTKQAYDIHYDCEGGLKERLEGSKAQVTNLSIPMGKTEDEMWKIFNIIYECINEGEDVYFDVTHGLRSNQFQVLTILNYAKVLKHISIGAIYYGAYDMGTEVIENGVETEKKTVPILDISCYNDILSWTNAADSFIKYGQSQMIVDEIKAYQTKVCRIPGLYPMDIQKAVNSYYNVACKIRSVTQSIDVGRGLQVKDNKTQSIYSAAKSFEEVKMGCKNIAALQPLNHLIEEMKSRVVDFCTDSVTEAGLATIAWCIEKGQIQQGYTALEETIKSYCCERYDFDVSQELYRDYVIGRIVNIMAKQDHSKTRIDAYFKWATLTEENESNDKKKLQEDTVREKALLFALSVEEKFVVIADAVKQDRNDINHFGMRKNPLSFSKFEQHLQKYYNDFLAYISTHPLEEKILIKKTRTFVNLSNHPVSQWSSKQLEAVKAFADKGEDLEIVDMEFPDVVAESDEKKVKEMTDKIIKEVIQAKPAAIMCQGEYTLSSYITHKLLELGYTVVAACSQRNCEEEFDEESGITHKSVNYEFVKFRKYIL